MRIMGENKEKLQGYSGFYIKVALFGALAAGLLIGGGITIKWLVNLIIAYWVWVIVGLFAIVLLKMYMRKRRVHHEHTYRRF